MNTLLLLTLFINVFTLGYLIGRKVNSNKNNMKRLKEFFSQIWLGFTLSNEFRNNHQQWPKI